MKQASDDWSLPIIVSPPRNHIRGRRSPSTHSISPVGVGGGRGVGTIGGLSYSISWLRESKRCERRWWEADIALDSCHNLALLQSRVGGLSDLTRSCVKILMYSVAQEELAPVLAVNRKFCSLNLCSMMANLDVKSILGYGFIVFLKRGIWEEHFNF